MKSRTSFCNGTLLRKNITRFAPLWGIYLLCLLIGLGLMYMDAHRPIVNFWFASHMAQCIKVMSVVNLFFAPTVAMFLFGDLFNSRMCNALHAMPVRRETLFCTNVVSGLLFSLIPTAVMSLLSIPLLAATVVHNAWQIAILWFVGVNLEFVCYFGIAVFCIFCTGNKLGFAALYALLNGGAFLIYVIVDMLYTPMLYGVVTPDAWAIALTPIANMVDDTFVEVSNYHDMVTLFDGRMNEAVANFWVDENYYSLILFALVGLGFMVLGLVMYRRRDLESAGDVVAVRWLAPVFQVAAAVAGGAMAVLCMEMFFYTLMRNNEIISYAMVVCGMAVGWFAGRMLLERSTRVFRIKNWIGLGILTAVFAVSLTMTHFDVFGIETRLPRVEKVTSVTLSSNGSIELTEKQDIDRIIRLQEMALEDRLEQGGGYPQSYVDSFDTNRIPYPEGGFTYGDEPGQYSPEEPLYYADWITLEYQMENGRRIQRQYTVWASFEEGEIIREYASRWENVMAHNRMGYSEEPDFSRIHDMTVEGRRLPQELLNEETVLSFLDAVKADCDERKMTQDSYYHEGRFKIPTEDALAEEDFYYSRNIYVDITTFVENSKELTGLYIQVYPDCTNTIAWLQQHDLLPYEMVEGNFAG